MKIGIIGGSGLYEIDGIEGVEEKAIDTPLGAPSASFMCGHMGGRQVFFLPRHGRGHRILPAEINHRANIMGMKMLGADIVISVSAVGSLREHMHPRDIVLPDQYFDRTKKSLEHTFFGNGLVAHVAFGEPTCPEVRSTIASVARDVIAEKPDDQQSSVHDAGTYVNMEGPAFSTKAESHAYRAMGFDIVGMTGLGEAKLCREAEICYQSMAMVTDYDCWHESEEGVSVEMVIGHLTANTALAKQILTRLVPRLPESRNCACPTALSGAMLSNPSQIPEETRQALLPIIGKYAT